jgi:hypothetical protein
LRLSLLIALMSAAAPAMAAPSAGAPLVKDGVEITILPSAGPSTGGVSEVTLDIEARSDDAAQRLGFRSMRGLTAIDCARGANRFIKADAFAEADLKGAATPRRVSGDWVRPASDSFMSGVTSRVCGGSPAPALTPSGGALPVVTMGASAAPAAATPRVASTPPPTRLALTNPPRPSESSTPARAFRASASGRGVAQVAASPTAEGAQHVLDRLRSLIAPPLAGGVEAATVNNAHLFRASVTGFVSLSDAQAFCARAASVSRTCWVHWKAAEAAPAHHP